MDTCKVEINGICDGIDDVTLSCLLESKRKMGRSITVVDIMFNHYREAALVTLSDAKDARHVIHVGTQKLGKNTLSFHQPDKKLWKKSTVFVHNVPNDTMEDEIYLRFESKRSWGRELDVESVARKETGMLYVTFTNERDANYVADKQQVKLFGTQLRIEGPHFLPVCDGDGDVNEKFIIENVAQNNFKEANRNTSSKDNSVGIDKSVLTNLNISEADVKLSQALEASFLETTRHEKNIPEAETSRIDAPDVFSKVEAALHPAFIPSSEAIQEQWIYNLNNQFRGVEVLPADDHWILRGSWHELAEVRHCLTLWFTQYQQAFGQGKAKGFPVLKKDDYFRPRDKSEVGMQERFTGINTIESTVKTETEKEFGSGRDPLNQTVRPKSSFGEKLSSVINELADPPSDNEIEKEVPPYNRSISPPEEKAPPADAKNKNKQEEARTNYREKDEESKNNNEDIEHMLHDAERERIEHEMMEIEAEFKEFDMKDKEKNEDNNFSTTFPMHQTAASSELARNNTDLPTHVIQNSTGSSASSPCLNCTMNNGTKIFVYTADITRLQVGAIVNAANEWLQHGAGLAANISKVAGPDFQKLSANYVKKRGKVPLGSVAILPAGRNLPCMHIINAVGPTWDQGSGKETCKPILTATFLKCFKSANEECRVRSMAVPLISSGIYRVPVKVVGEALFNALLDFDLSVTRRSLLKEIHIVDINVANLYTLSSVLHCKFRNLVTQ